MTLEDEILVFTGAFMLLVYYLREAFKTLGVSFRLVLTAI